MMADATLQYASRGVPVSGEKRPPSRKAEHFFWLDRLRFVAMLDIVAMHTVGNHLLHGVGLPMLLLISVALQAARVPPAAPGAVLARRARRLLVPWLFWCAVYTGWLVLQALGHGRPAWSWFQPLMPLYGPVIHLWFVPFIFLSAPVVAVIVGIAHSRRSRPAIAVFATSGILVVLAAAAVRTAYAVPQPFNQWVFSVGTIPLGAAIGLALTTQGKRRLRLLLALAGLGILLTAAGLEWVRFPFPCESWMLRRHGLALIGVCLMACLSGGGGPVTRLMVNTTFGVYLTHPLIFQVLREMRIVDGCAWTDFVVVYLLSAVITLAMRACPLKRFV
ncbi:MAG TPA: acyltransferase [Phycisphaerae bacterium]|nr:acyltransferase [Phycisphaerae bacterium]HQE42474.1 acyltransferase [Phycisphaerae bacterium]